MLAKKILKNATDIDYRINEVIAQHQSWERLYERVAYSPAIHSLVEDILENRETELRELIRLKENLEDIIMANDNYTQREILRLRYFHGMPWDMIADEMDAELDWIKKQHRKALKKIHVECTCCCDEDDYDAEEE